MVISFLQNNNRKRLFSKGKYQSIGFVFALIFSTLIMIADCHYHVVSSTRSAMMLVLSPIQYVVDYPVRMASWVSALVRSKKLLLDENIQLRYQQAILEAKLQKLLVIRNENQQLKQLLSATSAANDRVMAAEMLAVDTTSARQLLVINKGKHDGVYIGQPVLDAKGVTGQIIDVGPMTSTVMLISDSKSAVPVRNNRTGERAILVGMNRMNELSLINLPKSSLIAKGDLLVTSGLGRRYPEGYPVGVVQDVFISAGDDFIRVKVEPIALLNRSRLVLLIWPVHNHDKITAEIGERMKIVEADRFQLNTTVKA